MRVVAGKWRGRTLKAPRGLSVRPTTDRVREAIFDILGPTVAEAKVLDLFAGSGAMAIEALSRGAASAILVESDRSAFTVLRANLDALAAEGAEVLFQDYRQAIRRLKGREIRFDLVFLDPPYGKGLAADAARTLSREGLLASGAAVVVEEAGRSAEEAFPERWTRSTDRRYGDTRVMIFDVP